MTEHETQKTLTNPPGSEFGGLLRGFRERRNRISQSKLAEKAGYDHSFLSRLEAGSRMPTRESVERLAQAMELSQEETNLLLLTAGFATVTPAMLSEARSHLASALALLGGA